MAEDKIASSSSLASVDRLVGQKENLKLDYIRSYKTGDGQQLDQYILSSVSSILVPTCVDVNSCFEYRFSIKDFNLPSYEGIQSLYFENIVVKIQDIFTQITSHDCIKDGLFYFYSPYSAVVAQDEDGIETEQHDFTFKDKKETRDFVNTNRVIKRQDSPIYVCTSNLKVEKSLNLTADKNSYKVLILNNVYDERGIFLRKTITTGVSVTFEQLRQCLEPEKVDKKGVVCQDIILCDILLFMMKSFNISATKYFEDVSEADFQSSRKKTTVPRGWLSTEEKLEKYGRKGYISDNYTSNVRTETEIALPNDLYLFVDMQTVCDKLLQVAKPKNFVFDDKNGVIGGFHAQYAFAQKMASVTVHF